MKVTKTLGIVSLCVSCFFIGFQSSLANLSDWVWVPLFYYHSKSLPLCSVEEKQSLRLDEELHSTVESSK